MEDWKSIKRPNQLGNYSTAQEWSPQWGTKRCNSLFNWPPSPNPTHTYNLLYGERLHIFTDGLSETSLQQDGGALVMFMENTRVTELGEAFCRNNTTQFWVRADSQVCCVTPRSGNHGSTRRQCPWQRLSGVRYDGWRAPSLATVRLSSKVTW